jgi:hypothetical protein
MREAHRKLGIMQHIFRIVWLAALGYLAFAIPALVCHLVAESFVEWWAGIYLSLTFAASEILNSGAGQGVGLLRRLAITNLMLLGYAIVFGLIFQLTGWNGSFKSNEPLRIVAFAIVFIIYLIGLFGIRLVMVRRT